MTSNELAPRDTVGAFDPRNEKILAYLGLNPGDARSAAAVAVARRYDLDPVLKHVIVIPKGGVYITRDGLLHIAHQSGQLDGIVVEQEPELDEDGREWVARVSVWRKDMSHPFTYPGRYPVSGTNKEYAQEMALKAAESHALRRAFSIAGVPMEDELRPAPVKTAATRTAPPRTIREAVGTEALSRANPAVGPRVDADAILREPAPEPLATGDGVDWSDAAELPDPAPVHPDQETLPVDDPPQSALAKAQAKAKP